MKLQLSGMVFCSEPAKPKEGSEMASTFRPSEMFGFVRSLRYNPANSGTNAQDLFSVIKGKDECKLMEILLIVSDNGGDYSMDVTLLMILYGFLWRDMAFAMLLVEAFGAGQSSYNWEIESMWTKIQKLLAGIVFGKKKVDEARASGKLGEEDTLRDITDSATSQYLSLLAKCKTGGKAWVVEGVGNDCPMIPELDKLKVLVNASPAQVRQFAKDPEYLPLLEKVQDVFQHLEKSPSRLQFTVCTGAHPCKRCVEAIAKKQHWLGDLSWAPRQSLRLLAFSNYRLPFPTPRPDVKEQMVNRVGAACAAPAFPGVLEERAPPPTCLRLEELKEEVRQAVHCEDFMQAEMCNREKTNRGRDGHAGRHNTAAESLYSCDFPR